MCTLGSLVFYQYILLVCLSSKQDITAYYDIGYKILGQIVAKEIGELFSLFLYLN